MWFITPSTSDFRGFQNEGAMVDIIVDIVFLFSWGHDLGIYLGKPVWAGGGS